MIFGKNAKAQLFRQVSLVELLQARTRCPPNESSESLLVELVSEMCEDGFGHWSATTVALRHKQHLQLAPFLLATLIVIAGEINPREHFSKLCVQLTMNQY